MNFNLYAVEMANIMKGATFFDLIGFPRKYLEKSGINY